MKKFKSNLIVLSAPSGAGKTTITNRLNKKHEETRISISATTRGIRPREVDGRDYHFISLYKFKNHIKNNDFLEYEEVHGDYYGTLKNHVEDFLAEGHIVLFDIDVKGALHIKNIYPHSLLIFIKVPSINELRKRLIRRKSENQDAINKRLNRIEFENEQADKFDYVVINHNLNTVIEEIESLIMV